MSASPSVQREAEPYPFWRRNMYVMTAAAFSLTLGFGMVYPFLPLVLKEIGASGHLETWVGYAMGSYFGLSFFLTPLWGVVADHYGRKLMALRTSLGMALIFLLLPLAPSLGWFLVLFCLMGTTNGFIPATNALILTNTPARSMGRAISLVQTGTLIGGAVGPAVGALIASLLPAYRYLFWVGGMLLVAPGLLTLFFARERHERPEQPFRLHLIRDFAVIRRIPHISGLLYITFVFTFTFLGSATIISVFTLELLEHGGVQAGARVDFWIGAVTVAFTVSSAIVVPMWGRLLDRFGARRLLAFSLMAATIGSLPTIVAQTPLQLALARCCLGLLAIGVGPASLAMVRHCSPRGMESRVLSYAAACGALGIGGGPFIAGQIGPLFGLRTYFALNSLLILIGLLIWLRALARGWPADAVPGS